MAKQIAKLLKASIQDTSDLKQIAKQLAGKGRGGDTMLVHITPKEAKMLKASGGAGTINPDTGLLEFYDGDFDSSAYFTPSRVRSTDTDTYYSPRQAQTYSVPFGETEPISPYSFSPSAPPTQLTPPDSASFYSADMPQERLYSDVSFAPPTNIYQGVSTPFPISAEAATPSQVIAPSVPPVRSVDEGLLGRVGKFLTREGAGGVTPLERLGVAGLSALPGVLQARQAAQQGQRYREDLQRLAAPYQEQGKRLVEQAQRGELTAPNQQQIQAMQARLAQGVATRGGVGAEQAQVQLEAFRQQLLANQFDLGLKVSGIGDQIATGAIKSGLQADQYVSELTNSYFNNAFRMAMGGGAAAPTPVR